MPVVSSEPRRPKIIQLLLPEFLYRDLKLIDWPESMLHEEMSLAVNLSPTYYFIVNHLKANRPGPLLQSRAIVSLEPITGNTGHKVRCMLIWIVRHALTQWIDLEALIHQAAVFGSQDEAHTTLGRICESWLKLPKILEVQSYGTTHQVTLSCGNMLKRGNDGGELTSTTVFPIRTKGLHCSQYGVA